MTDQQLYAKLSMLRSYSLKRELSDYLDYLLSKQTMTDTSKTEPKPFSGFGCAKGKIRMHEDFDAPLDHFEEYVPQ